MTDSHRPRHSLDDDNFDEAFAFDDDPSQGDRATRAAAAAGAGAAAGSSAEDEQGSGLPLRGLAMILTAVAVLLIGWGIFSTTGDDSKDTETDAASQTSAQQPQADSNSAQPSAPAAPGASGASTAPNQPQPSASAPASQGAQAGVGQQAGQPGAAAIDRANQQITVLNNSPIQGLASGTAEKLRGSQWAKTSYGNLPDTQGAFPKSVVLYPAGDAAAQAAAEAAATDLGLRAETRNPEIDRLLSGAKMLQGEGSASVVVITTNDMPR